MSNQQVALSTAHTNSANISNAPVAAFLKKLYEMVNDPSTDDVIHWAEDGKSFFVQDHERLSREVLGRWFKHQNFNSFVRQLNMYGFHKIQHLQQGVLKSNAANEFWHFGGEPNFDRDRPDLMCLIQRKKQTNQPGHDTILDASSMSTAPPITSIASVAPATPAATTPPAGQILDLHSIVNGIASIKRHQTAISTELNDLKRSNQLLWQDAVHAREKHQKHEDTINRILKFLAGVFAHHSSPTQKEDGVDRAPSRAVVPRQPSRLMIEGAPRKGGKKKVVVTEVQDEEESNQTPAQFAGDIMTPGSVNSEPFASIETPTSTLPTSPSIAPSEATSPSMVHQPLYLPSSEHSIPRLDVTSPANNSHRPITTSLANQLMESDEASQPTAQPPLPHNLNTDTLNQPLTVQDWLNLLASLPPAPEPEQSYPPSSSQLAPYDPHSDISRAYTDPTLFSSPSPKASPAGGLVSLNPPDTDNLQRIYESWKDTEDVSRDVDTMDNNLNYLLTQLNPKLIDNMASSTDGAGSEPIVLDPSLLPPTLGGPMHPADTSTAQEFDPYNFLDFDGADIGDVASIIDAASDGTASPIAHIQQQHNSPEVSTTPPRGKKRSSAAADLEQPEPMKIQNVTQTRATKSKRKR